MILYNFKNKTNLFSVNRQETDAATEEQSTFLAYDKRVKELAQELTESQVTEPLYCPWIWRILIPIKIILNHSSNNTFYVQGVLADYNLLVDKLNTDAERIEITNEVAELKTQNESESRDVDSIFAEKQGRLNGGSIFYAILSYLIIHRDPIATS